MQILRADDCFRQPSALSFLINHKLGRDSVVAVFNFGDHFCDAFAILFLEIISDLGLLFID